MFKISLAGGLSYLFWKLCWLCAEMISVFIKPEPIILLGSESNTFIGNSKYLFLYLYEHRNTLPYKFYYVCPTKELYLFLHDQYKGRVVYKKSFLCWSLIMKARFGFITHGVCNLFFFVLRRTTIFNLWHGMPLKKIGYDVVNNTQTRWLKIKSLLGFDEFKRWNYFIVESTQFIPRILSATKLSVNQILPIGQPRTDYLYRYLNDAPHVRQLKSQILGKEKVDCQIILYAPTYRDDARARETFYSEVQNLCLRLNSLLANFNTCLLLKLHPYDADKITIQGENIYLADNWFDSQDILLVSDILITDYSSLVYDFSPIQRPILLYTFDYKQYDLARGFYQSLSELGCMCMTLDELVEQLKSLLHDSNRLQNSEEVKVPVFAAKQLVEQMLMESKSQSQRAPWQINGNK